MLSTAGAGRKGEKMELYRTDERVLLCTAEKLEKGDWRKLKKLDIPTGGLFISSMTDLEHDQILNIHDFSDADPLRGIMAVLYVNDTDGNDPEMINLLTIPQLNSTIRHQDRYYEVRNVIQSTSLSVAIVAKRVSVDSVLGHSSS